MIMKEDITPTNIDRRMYTIAPLLCLVGVFATLAVVPFSSGLTLSNLNIGVVYILGVSSLIGIGILLGGYASNSKWSMLGGMRGASQIISYEVPVTLSILSIVVLSGTLSFNTVIEAQTAGPGDGFYFTIHSLSSDSLCTSLEHWQNRTGLHLIYQRQSPS